MNRNDIFIIFVCNFKKLFLGLNLNLESILLNNYFINFTIYRFLDLKFMVYTPTYIGNNLHVSTIFLRGGEF
jgi:hypothetical protein